MERPKTHKYLILTLPMRLSGVQLPEQRREPVNVKESGDQVQKVS